MPTLGSVNAVMRILGRSSEEVSTADIEHFLNEADRKIKARNHQKYMVDSLYATYVRETGAVSLEYRLYFPIKEGETPEVYINGVKKTISTDYTFSDSVVTFSNTPNLKAGDRITFFYIPDFFDDYANYLAAERMYSVSLLDTNNAVSKAIYDTIKEEVKVFEQMSIRPMVAKFVDHREEFHDIF